MITTIRISSKNQIVVPKEARERLKLKKGSTLLVLVKDDRLVLIPKPANYVKKLQGLGKEIWQKDRGYLMRERKRWKN